jgi:hypothetical protein
MSRHRRPGGRMIDRDRRWKCAFLCAVVVAILAAGLYLLGLSESVDVADRERFRREWLAPPEEIP